MYSRRYNINIIDTLTYIILCGIRVFTEIGNGNWLSTRNIETRDNDAAVEITLYM